MSEYINELSRKVFEDDENWSPLDMIAEAKAERRASSESTEDVETMRSDESAVRPVQAVSAPESEGEPTPRRALPPEPEVVSAGVSHVDVGQPQTEIAAERQAEPMSSRTHIDVETFDPHAEPDPEPMAKPEPVGVEPPPAMTIEREPLSSQDVAETMATIDSTPTKPEPSRDPDAELDQATAAPAASVEEISLAVSSATGPMLKVDHSQPGSDLKGVPKEIIQRLREMLMRVPEFEEKAKALSIPNLVNAYFIHQLHVSDEGFKPEVQEAARAFGYYDPLLLRVEALMSNQRKQNEMLQKIMKGIHAVGDVESETNLGMAYLLAERTGQLDTSHVMPETMDMIQPKVLKARNRMKDQAETVVKRESRTKGSSHYFRG